MGKFMLLTGALKQGYLPLVIMAAINTAISIYYYLSVVRVAYCNGPEERPVVIVNGVTKSVSLALMVIILALGLAPNQIIQIATDVVRTIQ
jgi:NADH-quinone oxidoreductase subunit N